MQAPACGPHFLAGAQLPTTQAGTPHLLSPAPREPRTSTCSLVFSPGNRVTAPNTGWPGLTLAAGMGGTEASGRGGHSGALPAW